MQVFDEDIGDDELLGMTKMPLNDLVPETHKEVELRLLPKLDMTKVKDKKDRGTITLKVSTATYDMFPIVIFFLYAFFISDHHFCLYVCVHVLCVAYLFVNFWNVFFLSAGASLHSCI